MNRAGSYIKPSLHFVRVGDAWHLPVIASYVPFAHPGVLTQVVFVPSGDHPSGQVMYELQLPLPIQFVFIPGGIWQAPAEVLHVAPAGQEGFSKQTVPSRAQPLTQ